MFRNPWHMAHAHIFGIRLYGWIYTDLYFLSNKLCVCVRVCSSSGGGGDSAPSVRHGQSPCFYYLYCNVRRNSAKEPNKWRWERFRGIRELKMLGSHLPILFKCAEINVGISKYIAVIIEQTRSNTERRTPRHIDVTHAFLQHGEGMTV